MGWEKTVMVTQNIVFSLLDSLDSANISGQHEGTLSGPSRVWMAPGRWLHGLCAWSSFQNAKALPASGLSGPFRVLGDLWL